MSFIITPQAAAGNGNSTITSSGTNIQLTVASARMQVVTMTATGLSVILPDATLSSLGSPVYVIKNAGSNTFAIRDFGGNFIIAIAAGQQITMSLTSQTTSNGTWTVGNESIFSTLSPLLANATNSLYSPASYAYPAKISATKWIVTSVDSGVAIARILTVSGTTVTVGAANTLLASGASVAQAVSVFIGSTTQAIYVNGANAYLLTISGDTVTIGAAVPYSTLGVSTTYGATQTIVCTGPNTAIALYETAGPTYPNTPCICGFVLSGSTITATADLKLIPTDIGQGGHNKPIMFTGATNSALCSYNSHPSVAITAYAVVFIDPVAGTVSKGTQYAYSGGYFALSPSSSSGGTYAIAKSNNLYVGTYALSGVSITLSLETLIVAQVTSNTPVLSATGTNAWTLSDVTTGNVLTSYLVKLSAANVYSLQGSSVVSTTALSATLGAEDMTISATQSLLIYNNSASPYALNANVVEVSGQTG